MHQTVDGIVCSALAHGEHGAVVRFLTPSGLVAGFVAGGRSRRTKPVIAPGNAVHVQIDRRNDTQLARARVELSRSRAALAFDPLSLAIAEWLTSLCATRLPEDHPYPQLYDALAATLDVAELAEPPARLAALARFELLLLAEMGFGLDLSSCVATGDTEDLAYISPRTGRAVSRAAGRPHAAKLFPMPSIFSATPRTGATPAYSTALQADIETALRVTRHFIERDLLTTGHHRQILAARDRIEARLPGAIAGH